MNNSMNKAMNNQLIILLKKLFVTYFLVKRHLLLEPGMFFERV